MITRWAAPQLPSRPCGVGGGGGGKGGDRVERWRGYSIKCGVGRKSSRVEILPAHRKSNCHTIITISYNKFIGNKIRLRNKNVIVTWNPNENMVIEYT